MAYTIFELDADGHDAADVAIITKLEIGLYSVEPNKGIDQ